MRPLPFLQPSPFVRPAPEATGRSIAGRPSSRHAKCATPWSGGLIQGEPDQLRLQEVRGLAVVAADWERAAAGTWRVRVTCGHRSIDNEFFIEPAKISRGELEILVTSLEERLPPSIALRLARCGAFAGLFWQPPSDSGSTLSHEIEQVRRAVEGAPRSAGLLEVLHRLAANPHATFVTEHRWTRTEGAKRPVVSRLAAALARTEARLDGGLPAWVLDGRVRFSVDTAENRLVREFYTQVDRRLRALEGHAHAVKTFGEFNRTTVERLGKRLRSARRNARFLEDVGPLGATPDRLSQVLLCNPVYAAALEGFTRLRLNARVRLDLPLMDAPLENIPRLYEVWCSLVVIDSILAAAERHAWSADTQTLVALTNAGPYVSMSNSRAVLRLSRGSRTATLFTQPRYLPHGKGLHSISYAQVPDLALMLEEPGHRPQLHLFDLKYKLSNDEADTGGGPTKTDVDKMHT